MNTKSSPTEPVQSHSLNEIVAALHLRGRHLEAVEYGLAVPMLLEIMYDVPQDVIMAMTPDEILELVNKPQPPKGWTGSWYPGENNGRDNS